MRTVLCKENKCNLQTARRSVCNKEYKYRHFLEFFKKFLPKNISWYVFQTLATGSHLKCWWAIVPAQTSHGLSACLNNHLRGRGTI